MWWNSYRVRRCVMSHPDPYGAAEPRGWDRPDRRPRCPGPEPDLDAGSAAPAGRRPRAVRRPTQSARRPTRTPADDPYAGTDRSPTRPDADPYADARRRPCRRRGRPDDVRAEPTTTADRGTPSRRRSRDRRRPGRTGPARRRPAPRSTPGQRDRPPAAAAPSRAGRNLPAAIGVGRRPRRAGPGAALLLPAGVPRRGRRRGRRRHLGDGPGGPRAAARTRRWCRCSPAGC